MCNAIAPLPDPILAERRTAVPSPLSHEPVILIDSSPSNGTARGIGSPAVDVEFRVTVSVVERRSTLLVVRWASALRRVVGMAVCSAANRCRLPRTSDT